MEPKTNYRQVAVKISIGEILNSKYIREDEQKPNHILSLGGEKIYRVNLTATVVDVDRIGNITTFLVDDSTGKIFVRIFEKNELFEKIRIGETVLIIGKVRVFNEEKYISPEIVKKVSPLWLKARFFEQKWGAVKEKSGLKIEDEEVKEQDIMKKVKEESSFLPEEKIIFLIKELDKGEGALIEEIVEKSLLPETEKMLEKMLEKGDIFQNMPGKVKIL